MSVTNSILLLSSYTDTYLRHWMDAVTDPLLVSHRKTFCKANSCHAQETVCPCLAPLRILSETAKCGYSPKNILLIYTQNYRTLKRLNCFDSDSPIGRFTVLHHWLKNFVDDDGFYWKKLWGTTWPQTGPAEPLHVVAHVVNYTDFCYFNQYRYHCRVCWPWWYVLT